MDFKKKLSVLCCAVLMALYLCPSGALASYYDENEILRRDVMEYITMNDDGVMVFDEEKAYKNGERADVMEVGKKVAEFSMYYNLEKKGISTYNGLPIYGNYCGPGHTSDTLEPIDFLDKQCKIHDECYAKNGYFHCDCDQALIDTLEAKINKLSGVQKNTANAIIIYFKGQMAVKC